MLDIGIMGGKGLEIRGWWMINTEERTRGIEGI